MTYEKLAKIIAKMTPEQRKMKVLFFDENVGEFYELEKPSLAEDWTEPISDDYPSGQLTLTADSAAGI